MIIPICIFVLKLLVYILEMVYVHKMKIRWTVSLFFFFRVVK